MLKNSAMKLICSQLIFMLIATDKQAFSNSNKVLLPAATELEALEANEDPYDSLGAVPHQHILTEEWLKQGTERAAQQENADDNKSPSVAPAKIQTTQQLLLQRLNQDEQQHFSEPLHTRSSRPYYAQPAPRYNPRSGKAY